jgi:hypothetical protein
MAMGFDYGDKERNDAEAERVKQEGRAAAKAGQSPFGAGGYMPGDWLRAHYWRIGYREVNPNHPDLPGRYRAL